jgi:hypothetical protein
MIAFAQGSADELPDDLFGWVRVALETTTAELALVLVAWAHVERGDADMGDHLVEAARDRIDATLFRRAYPKVHTWLRNR